MSNLESTYISEGEYRISANDFHPWIVSASKIQFIRQKIEICGNYLPIWISYNFQIKKKNSFRGNYSRKYGRWNPAQQSEPFDEDKNERNKVFLNVGKIHIKEFHCSSKLHFNLHDQNSRGKTSKVAHRRAEFFVALDFFHQALMKRKMTLQTSSKG